MADRNQQRGVQHSRDRNSNAKDQWEPENSRGPRGYGHSQNYEGALGYPDETLRSPQVDHKHTQPGSGSTSGSRALGGEDSSSSVGNVSQGNASTTPKSK